MVEGSDLEWSTCWATAQIRVSEVRLPIAAPTYEETKLLISWHQFLFNCPQGGKALRCFNLLYKRSFGRRTGFLWNHGSCIELDQGCLMGADSSTTSGDSALSQTYVLQDPDSKRGAHCCIWCKRLDLSSALHFLITLFKVLDKKLPFR